MTARAPCQAIYRLASMLFFCLPAATYPVALGEVVQTIACGGQLYLLDQNASAKIFPGFSKGLSYSGGRAAISDGKKWGYIDDAGIMRVPLAFERADFCTEGLCPVCLTVENRYSVARCGYVDVDGNAAISFNYEEVGTFRAGLAMARKGSTSIVLRKDGSEAYRSEGACYLPSFSGDQLLCRTTEGSVFVDIASGLVALGPYRGAIPFSAGVAGVQRIGDDTWRLIDTKGRNVGRDAFDRVESFSEGMAAAWRSGMCGYITGDGRFRIPPRYFACAPMSRGMALVRAARGYQYLDSGGGVAIEGPFAEAERFQGDYARVLPTGGNPMALGTLKPTVSFDPLHQFLLIDKLGRGLQACDGRVFNAVPK